MIRTLVIGLGGFGLRVAGELNKQYNNNHRDAAFGPVACVGLDCDVADITRTAEETGLRAFQISDNSRISDLLELYAEAGAPSWLYSYPALLHTVDDFGARSRQTARLRFMHFVESGRAEDLENIIAEAAASSDPQNKLRIVLVSSLCGSTGSALVILFSLYIQRLLRSLGIAGPIYGVFATPDIYAEAFEAVRCEPQTMEHMNSLCYATVKEINTVSKALMGQCTLELSPFIRHEENAERRPLLDGVYLFSTAGVQNAGAYAGGIGAAVSDAARLIGQRFASAHAPYFNSYEHIDLRTMGRVGKFGSGAVTTLSYPSEDMAKYLSLRLCAERAAPYWTAVERENQEKDHSFTTYSAAYIKGFDRRCEEQREGFDALREGTVSVYKTESEDGITEERRDRADEFILSLERLCNEICADACGDDIDRCAYFPDINEVNDTDSLRLQIDIAKARAEDFLKLAPAFSRIVFARLMEEVMPSDSDSARFDNESSVLSCLAKKGEDGSLEFVNPASAKYVLHKVCEKARDILSVRCNEAHIAHLESTVRNGDSHIWDTADFVSASKSSAESFAPLAAIERKKLLMVGNYFLKRYMEAYEEYRHELCERMKSYVCVMAMRDMLSALIERVSELIKAINDPCLEAADILAEAMERSRVSNEREVGASKRFIYASAAAKDRLYSSLDIPHILDFSAVNEVLYRETYKKVLAGEGAGRAVDVTHSLVYNLLKETRLYTRRMFADSYAMDIIGAICRESDLECAYDGQESAEERAERYTEKIKGVLDELFWLTDRRLVLDAGQQGLEYRQIVRSALSVHPHIQDIVRRCCEDMSCRAEIIESPAVSPEELSYVSAVGGVDVSFFPGFCEADGEIYKAAYERWLAAARADDLTALAMNPHLDKSWQELLNNG